MKKVLQGSPYIFLFLLLSLGQAWAENCSVDQDLSLVCTSNGENSVTTDKILAPSSIVPGGYRYWYLRDVKTLAQRYSPALHYGWERYFEVNCNDASEITLDSNSWGAWIEYERVRRDDKEKVGERHYFTPTSYQAVTCRRLSKKATP